MSDQERPSEDCDEHPDSPSESLAETLTKLEATMNELIARVQHLFARRD
jgi:hypothetical protein